jgi:hypothetical protein
MPPAPGWWKATDGVWYPPQAPPIPGLVPYGQPSYGAQPAYVPSGMYPKVGLVNGPAKTGGTIGIIGAGLSLIPLLGIVLGLVLGIIAVIFSIIGMSRSDRYPIGKGMATVGLVLGILTIIFKLIPGVNLL